MYSVFLVEDEIAIREGLKSGFPWEQYGFAFVGDAEDGEMALPLILQAKPDVLITDIRMPFMDGIDLSKMVKKELPDTRIIIISGFDDFSYAQEAISIGVDKYVLKPITKDKLAEVLTVVKSKLDTEQEKNDYLGQFRMENQEYEQFSRIRFFNQLMAGAMSVSEIYEKSKELSLDLDAEYYNLILLNVVHKSSEVKSSTYSNAMAQLSDQLSSYFMVCPEYIFFHWNLDSYGIIIKGDDVTIKTHTRNCIENISRRCSDFEKDINWYLAEGKEITRFSEFVDSFNYANKKLSCRYMSPKGHIFTDENVKALNSKQENTSVVDQKLVGLFLENGMKEEILGFIDNLVPGNTSEALNSLLFSRYFAMTMYICICDYIKKLGHDPAKELEEDVREKLESEEGEGILTIVGKMMEDAIGLRDGESQKQYKGQLLAAMRYVDEHFSDVNLCLNDVAKEINISPSYLSAMFSREAKTTFVEYMTGKRMEAAADLLKSTEEKTSAIAEKVGYKDSHYFGFIFKKTYGVSPKEYRLEGK